MEYVFDLPEERGVRFTVEMPPVSGVDDLRHRTPHSMVQLIIQPEGGVMTWSEFLEKGFKAGDLMTMGYQALPDILEFFLPDDTVDAVGVQFETDGGVPLAHTYMTLGHHSLFSMNGIIRRPTDSLLRPEIIIRGVPSDVPRPTIKGRQ